jgi:hypothetical protein
MSKLDHDDWFPCAIHDGETDQCLDEHGVQRRECAVADLVEIIRDVDSVLAQSISDKTRCELVALRREFECALLAFAGVRVGTRSAG